jgi:SAM-dependent methyltransferase
MLRVGLSFDAEEIAGTRTAFDLGSLEHLHCFESALHGVGRSLTDFSRMLDFGCGCGRFLRHLRPISDRVEIHGTDIDAEMIRWVMRHIPYADARVGQVEPPLPYPDEHFDLVINHSVFSHLNEHHQDLWLAELGRITRSGGLLLLTVEGQSSWNRTAAYSEQAGDDVERWRAQLEARGILVITDDHFIGSTHPDSYHSTIHAPWYVFEHWSDYFDIRAYLVDGSISQDLVVLRRRSCDVPAVRPIARRFGAARHWSADDPAARANVPHKH